MSDDIRTDSDGVAWSLIDERERLGYDAAGACAELVVAGRFPDRRRDDPVPTFTMYRDQAAFIGPITREIVELLSGDDLWSQRAALEEQMGALRSEVAALRSQQAELRTEQARLKQDMPHNVALKLATAARRLNELEIDLKANEDALDQLRAVWDDLDERADDLIDFAYGHARGSFVSAAKTELTLARRAIEQALQPLMARLYRASEQYHSMHTHAQRLAGSVKLEAIKQLTDQAPVGGIAHVAGE